MKPRTMHNICRAGFLLCSLVSSAKSEPTPSIVNSQSFDIEYAVNEAALPLAAVQLWYTTDGGATWTEYGRDEDRISPIRFRAPGEGTFGFYFVLSNSSGPSGPAPVKNTPPQQVALVDLTPPLLQLHQVRAVPGLEEMTVQIRWTAVDAHFPPRPIEVLFGMTGGEITQRATPDPVANTGMFDWRVPSEVTGSVAIKIAATDRAGQTVESEALWVEVDRPKANIVKTEATIEAQHPIADDTALAGSSRAKARAAELFAQALDEGRQGRLVEGISRLREAVKLDPQLTEAFAEMGGMFYLLGDLDRAGGAYEIAIRQQPNHRVALRGMARINERKGRFAAAAAQLQTILLYNPKDAEVWLQMGDVAVHQGDEIRARECYLRATQIDPQASSVIADARQRLELMAEMSRRPGNPK